MKERTIELIMKIGTEVFHWVMTILKDKRRKKEVSINDWYEKLPEDNFKVVGIEEACLFTPSLPAAAMIYLPAAAQPPIFPRSSAMAFIKENLIQSLQDQCGFSKSKSRILVETTFELVKKSLESGDDLTPDGRTVVTFRSSPVLREKLNGGG